MKYERQTQEALDRLDQALLALNKLIREGKKQEALQFMEEGALKEVYEDLQSMITISQTGNLGARGTSQTGAL